jgi:hypothetical protein
LSIRNLLNSNYSMMKKLIGSATIISLSLPFVAFADSINNIDNIFAFIQKMFGYATVIVISLAVLYFLYGVLNYVTKGSEAEERTKAIGMIITGIVAIFVMISVWGLVGILTGTFNLGGNQAPAVPRLPTAN